MITTSFPPQLGGVSEKMAKRAKYFARFGWSTTVLAPEIAVEVGTDDSLTAELEGCAVKIIRTGYLSKNRTPSLRHDQDRGPETSTQEPGLRDLFYLPRGYLRWMPSTLARGVGLARDADVILTVNNPISLHIIGFLLHRMTGTPWVAELRDPIVGYAYSRRGPEGLNRWLERLIFTHADAIVQREDFVPGDVRKRHPDLPASKFHSIPYTGYDPDDFPQIRDDFSRPKPDDQVFSIAYTGNFYGTTITPIPFIHGLHLYHQRSGTRSPRMEVRFAGGWGNSYDDLVADLGLADQVSYLGWLTRKDCIQLWEKSDLLLLLLGNEADNVARIPSKFWDYLGSRRPILALVPPKGKLAEIIRKHKLGFVADPENEEEIAAAIAAAVESFSAGDLVINPTPDFTRLANRAVSEEQLARILNSVIRRSEV